MRYLAIVWALGLTSVLAAQTTITGAPTNSRTVTGTRVRVYTPGPLPRPVRRAPTLAILHARMPELDFEAVPLETAIDQIAAIANVNIMPNWGELLPAGVQRDQPVSMRVRDVPLRTVLWLLMREMGAGDVELAFEARPDYVMITTREALDSEVIVRVYEIAELVTLDPVYPAFDIGQTRQYVSGLEPVVGDNVGIVRPIIDEIVTGTRVGDPADPNGMNENSRRGGGDAGDTRQQQKIDRLVRVITRTVEPEHWDINGGPGRIDSFGTKLVVRASPLVHQMIGGPLRDE